MYDQIDNAIANIENDCERMRRILGDALTMDNVNDLITRHAKMVASVNATAKLLSIARANEWTKAGVDTTTE